ncbi:bifunctional protein-serine/threonine kinase/phosphatase [Hydrogenophaga taeniospiralis]|uniref:bifunctional protein-serine/threonine kinase/phosphatase n=1 Tax=Hydrogenophaga taeniospiralis TaxID=65656 RepID=UPI001CFBE37A|nr:bifunctional protein-serine/threonine kinase/phosphatase [Hydrogenophaga taeniospiralis]MCB4366288.1 bifunctional protein-serine/threonine kinase/phosphatase [Hydrogenophaga taeniospiralis]
MAFHIDIGFVCQTGRKEKNEDFCAAMLPPAGQEDMGSIVAIADGVSTGGMGGEAAQTTVTSLVRSYHDTPETWDTTVALDRIIGAQNTWLTGTNHRRQPAMGLTTLTALVLRGQSYTVAHVGDSRCYLLREGQTLLLTHDHVVNHPDMRHQLLRAVGLEDHLVVDYLQGDLQVGDTFVMLTDGVHGKLSERRIAECAAPAGQAAGAQPAAERLVAEALAAGSDDNVTAMVVRVRGLQGPNLQDAGRAAQSLPVPHKLKVGESIDGLTVTATVADNGINLLYQVRDPQTQTLYALKTLHPARAHDQDERAMLAHEAWLAKRMMSSRAAGHLVAIHDHLPNRLPRSACYLLYDWHSGETLQQLLDRQQKLGPGQAVSVAMQTLRVLGLLHRQGVIHRDIKPANLHQGDDGVLRVLDLGVALTGREPESMRRLHAGTPSFVNPEQWGHHGKAAGGSATEGEPELPDAQSDLFALGVTLYQLLTGKLPYGEVLPYQVGRYYRDPTAPSRHNPEVPIWLDHVLQKAVARDKSLRFETAEEFLLALERGASRPLTVPPASALLQRDPTMLWKLLLGFSVLFNLLLVYWLLFLPK